MRGLAGASIVRTCKFAVLVLASALMVLPFHAALGKPMAKPTLQEALGSDWIVQVHYVDFAQPLFEPADAKDANKTPKIVSFKRTEEFDYFDPPHAEYRVDRILKEPTEKERQRLKVGDLIRVPFHFHDLSACVAPKEWKFRRSLLPKKDSVWILYLKAANEHYGPTEYETYRGDFGRVPGTPENFSILNDNLRSNKANSSVPER